MVHKTTIRVFLYTFFCTTALYAQKLEKSGLTFLSPAVYQTIYPQKGATGSYPMVKVGSWACNLDATAGLNYKGKNYKFTDFNGQLQVFFNAIKVTRLNISFDVAGVTSDNGNTSIEGLWRMGDSKGNSLVNVAKGGTLAIVNTTIHGISEIQGLEALKARIDELEEQQNKETPTTNVITEQKTNLGKSDYWATSSGRMATNNTSSVGKSPQNSGYSSSPKTATSTSAKSYQDVGKYESSGSGIIYPVGQGIKRADGNYNVVDKYGKTHIIDPKTNEKLEIRQRDAEAKQRMANQQQQLQEKINQQQAAREKQQQLNKQREAQINAFADQVSNAAYQIGTGIANIINESKAKKERERQRQLELKQQEEARRLKLEQDRQFRIELRSNIFNGYKDSSFPISTSKIPYDKLYYFIYAYDSTAIDKEGLTIYLTNQPFEIARYSDGTWPYKKSVVDKTANLTPNKEIITGYYPSFDEAMSAIEFFKDNLSKSNVVFQDVKYQTNKLANSTKGNMDNFWKKTPDTTKVDSTATKPKPKDEYWK